MYGEFIYPNFFSTFLMFPFSLNSKIHTKDYIDALVINGWEKEGYQITHGTNYNEYVYFYPYIWDILFNKKENLSSGKETVNGVSFFKYPFSDKNATFSVKVRKAYANWERDTFEIKNPREVILPLKNIFLHIFEVGIGILIFEIVNDVRFSLNEENIYSLTDYLRFLETGRRVFVPFVNGKADLTRTKRISEHQLKRPKETELSGQGYMAGLDAVHKGFIPEKVQMDLGRKPLIQNFFAEPFLIDKNGSYKPALSKIITYFLNTSEFTYENDDYKSIIDERMFVHSYFSIEDSFQYKKSDSESKILPTSNHAFIEELKNTFRYGIKNTNFNDAAKLWYQMIFLDWNDPSCQNPGLAIKLLEESTYMRWSDFGSLSGFSRFSSVMVSNITEAGFIYNHFQSMYYQIAILLLFYRGAILNFSDRSENLSNRIHDLPSRNSHGKKEKKKLNSILNEVDRLNKEFLLFRNKFWFREVTAQDQGIEIFDLWSKQLRNKELMQDVESEIHALFEFVDSLNEKIISRKVNIITYIGGIFLPIAIITSFFGMNFSFITPNTNSHHIGFIEKIMSTFSFKGYYHWFEFGSLIILSGLLILLEICIYKWKGKSF